MDRVRKISIEILDKHPSQFGDDFTENKKTLEKIAVVRSKQLRNKIAGFITKYIKKEARHEEQLQNVQESQEGASIEQSEVESNEDREPIEIASGESSLN
ncbi:MAG: hypothetical protein GWN01_00670 [Nitrosopumilaceae archaeon]|nr:hypothetical protein [Nitrosopumilaceae archaeon]NIT99494.1 hypothetical protein [Nitrosopumilaceae archaeon]NIU85853.1 hypothetical protein [Nitrosopumilaceae archaeon]NIV64710.1 hypothetical protein [Nitrosopumilaceae archaeon]NIX60097.1 hypothetical protein [Nitrosopumilaceae archaeon]